MRHSLSSILALFISAQFASGANSLVITEHDQDTLLLYHQYVRTYTDVEAEISFFNRNLSRYCVELRKARVYQLADPNENMESYDSTSNNNPQTQKIPAASLIFEKNQAGMQRTKFLVGKSRRSLTHYSFQCAYSEGELLSFVAPAFIPDSAFLFIAQPSFISQQNDRKEVPSRLFGIIDELATRTNDDLRHIVAESMKLINHTRTDPLCDLKPMLKYRLCAIVSAKIHHIRRAILSRNDGTVYDYYPNRSYNRYYPADPQSSCRPINLHSVIHSREPKGITTHRMLHCFIDRPGYMLSFYLGTNMLEKSKVYCLIRHMEPDIGWAAGFYEQEQFQVPLLKHLDKYERVLGDVNI